MIFPRRLFITMTESASTTIAENLAGIQSKITKAWEQRCLTIPTQVKPELVAVSKIQPAESIVEAYKAGQRHFGENYIQELIEKVNNPLIKENCPDIKWHFIGNIQRNKVNKLFSFPIHLIQSVDSLKLLDHMTNALKNSETIKSVNILLQVNTSGEESKGGVEPDEVCKYVQHIKDSCQQLKFQGLMTIGEANIDPSQPNKDFQLLAKLRDDLVGKGLCTVEETHLSMGMSADFQQAISMGSTIVRVGTAIFGARPVKQKEAKAELS